MQYKAIALIGLLFLPLGGSVAEAASPSDDPSPSTVAGAATVATTTSLTVKLTAYNAVASQTDGNPSVTASGLHSNDEIMAARSSDLAKKLPYGTVIKITRTYADTPSCGFHTIESQIGYRVIGDAMNSRWKDRVDIELNADDTVVADGRVVNPAIALGVCSNVTVTVVGHIDLADVPKTEAALARLYTPSHLAIAF